jgi:hypothetical protein
MVNETKTYLLRAAAILKANPTPLLVPAGVGAFFYIPAPTDNSSGFIFLLPVILLFIIYPLIYGRYTEIINNDKHISYAQIFATHWFNFFVVSLILGSPILFFTILGLQLAPGLLSINKFLSITIDILSIYIFPLVFLLKKRGTCIPLGIKCLIGNFSFSVPLMLLTLIPFILNSLTAYPAEAASVPPAAHILNYSFWLINIVLDFVIFIAAALILKDKLLQI